MMVLDMLVSVVLVGGVLVRVELVRMCCSWSWSVYI